MAVRAGGRPKRGQRVTQRSPLEFSGEVAAVADVTAGTVGTTLDLAEVTGASTSFVTAMAGRYIQIADFGWQRIAYVSSSTILALESP